MSNFEIMKRKFLLLRFIFSFPRGGREKLPRLIEIVGDRREIMARGGRQSPANGNYLLEPDEIRQRTIKNGHFSRPILSRHDISLPGLFLNCLDHFQTQNPQEIA